MKAKNSKTPGQKMIPITVNVPSSWRRNLAVACRQLKTRPGVLARYGIGIVIESVMNDPAMDNGVPLREYGQPEVCV